MTPALEHSGLQVYQGDALNVLRELPDDCVDLVFTSPPYEAARTYGIDFKLRGQEWVDWCFVRFMECLRVCKGVVCWNVEGQTKDFRWSAVPLLLAADLHRAGVHLRKPSIFQRVGIPGSGGPDWLRNDYEFIICGTKGGKLPWSDSCVMGHPPVYLPGGAMSNRNSDGQRKNARGYSAQKIAGFSYWSIRKLLTDYCDATKTGTNEVLQGLCKAVAEKAVSKWLAGIAKGLRKSELLRPDMFWRGEGRNSKNFSGGCEREDCGEQNHKESLLQKVRVTSESTRPSSRRKSSEQQAEQSRCSMQRMPPKGTPQVPAVSNLWQKKSVQATLREALSQVAAEWGSIDEESQSALSAYSGANAGRKVITRNGRGSRDNGVYSPPVLANPGNVIEQTYTASEVAAMLQEASEVTRHKVGGGVMGSPLAHLNEAPFPESLPEFFIRSFCPEGGTVLDCFLGSGTTAAVARRWGRKCIGIDIRKSQVDLAARRNAQGLLV